jgi:hypothetical protein
LLILAILVAGCQNDSKSVAAGEGSAGQTASTSASDSSSAPSSQTTAPLRSDTSSPQEPSQSSSTPGSSSPSVPDKNSIAKGETTIPLKNLPPEIGNAIKSVKKGTDSKLDIPTAASEDWSPYVSMPLTQAATAIADRVQQSIAHMENTVGKIEISYGSTDSTDPTYGGNGSFNQVLKVKNATTYQVPFLVVGDNPLTCEEVANGKVRMTQYGPEWRERAAVTSPTKAYTADPGPVEWPREFTQLIYEPITHSPMSWTDAMQAWLDPSKGYKVTIEQRAVPMTVKNAKTGAEAHFAQAYFRLLINRDADPQHRYGKTNLELVIDAHKWLPVQIRSIFTDKADKKTWKVSWNCDYRFGESLNAKDFIAPYTSSLGKHNS